MGRYAWSNRLTVEECRSLNIASLVTSGLFRYSSPQTRAFLARGLKITVTCHPPTAAIEEWVSSDRLNEKAPAIGDRLTLSYTLGNEYGSRVIDTPQGQGICYYGPQKIDLEVGVLSIPSPLRHEKRYYFKCPGIDDPCGRRVGKLYLPPSGSHLACRHCYDLTYKSCKEHDSRVDRMVRQLGPVMIGLRGEDAANMLVRCAGGNRVVFRAMLRIMEREGML